MRLTVKMLCWLLLAVGTCWAAKVNSPLLGAWQAAPNDNTRINYQFSADGTVFWMYQQDTYWSGIKAKYRLNAQTMPMQLDLYDFSDPDMAGVVLRGIVEFSGATAFKLQMARDTRPAEFTADALQFAKSQDKAQ